MLEGKSLMRILYFHRKLASALLSFVVFTGFSGKKSATRLLLAFSSHFRSSLHEIYFSALGVFCERPKAKGVIL